MFRLSLVASLRSISDAIVISRRRAQLFSIPQYKYPARLYSAQAGLPRLEVEGRIVNLFMGIEKVGDPAKLTPTADFYKDLGLDSLDSVEAVMAIEEEFCVQIPDEVADRIRSIDQAVDYIVSQPDAN